MIRELHIENVVVIERATVLFEDRVTTIRCERSRQSVLLSALSLACGRVRNQMSFAQGVTRRVSICVLTLDKRRRSRERVSAVSCLEMAGLGEHIDGRP